MAHACIRVGAAFHRREKEPPGALTRVLLIAIRVLLIAIGVLIIAIGVLMIAMGY